MRNDIIIKIFFLTLILLAFFGLSVFYYSFTDYICLAIVFICSIGTAIKSDGMYPNLIKLYAIFVMVSCVYSSFANHQGLVSVIGHSYDYFALLYFFVLIRVNLTLQETVKLLEMLTLSFCIGYILQWLVYPTILFSGVERFAIGDERYRARMTGSICCYYLLMYAINNYLIHRKMKFVLYGILAFVPIIIQGFRSMVVLSAIASLLMIPFVVKNFRKSFYYALLGVICAFLLLQTSLVQSKINEMLNRQEKAQTFDNDDYIRYRSLNYYWNYQFTNPIEKIVGGGVPSDLNSTYTKEINNAIENSHFYWVDLGLVGLSMIIGIPAVLILVIIYGRCIWRCKASQIQYVRFTMIIVLLGSIFTTEELFREGNILLLSFLLYIEYRVQKDNLILHTNALVHKRV